MDQQGLLNINFTSGKIAYRHHQGFSRRDPLARAVGIKKEYLPTIIDATAGLGRDAFTLAALGCEVVLLERSPLVAASLQQAIEQARVNPTVENIMARMQLQHVNSIDYLMNLSAEQYPDVIYIDPMYPASAKSALVKKEMRVLRELVGADEDAEILFSIALQCAKKRVVVKRHRHAKTISSQRPHHVIENKVIRFDIYTQNV